jgi:AGCS family alanine or glycine:cation symporter
MNRKDNFFKIISFFIFFNLPKVSGAQQVGLDDKINEAFTPIANWWGGVVLHSFPGTSIPTIIFLLVGGALFFTLYFNFVNLRRIPLAIRTVSGRYDALDQVSNRDFGNDSKKKKTYSK